ncbi:MAG: hypothetical protein K5886_09505 [Lachnospiraceae bacterium]|nr:hypothetical protein [Lachnospiraceae bacterium]
MSDHMIDNEELDKVTGGTGQSGNDRNIDAVKYAELEAVCREQGYFNSEDFNRHSLDALCDRWKEKNYKPDSAREFLLSLGK